jgi:sugar/nucleoside kinase (ribokinase family)
MKGVAFDAIGIGACNLDTIAFVPKFTEREEKINASSYVPPRSAGVALDAITQIAYLGSRCGFIGKRGNDSLGQIFEEEMKLDNIDLSRLVVVPGEMTSLAWIQVTPDGERCHVIIPMTQNGFLTPGEMDERKTYIQSARICHMELLQMPIAALVRAAELCRESGTLVSVDLDIAPSFLYHYGYADPKELNCLFSLTDILKGGGNAVATMFDTADMGKSAVELLKMGPKIVVITKGDAGCVVAYCDNGEITTHESPAFRDTPVKDTTGAGDAFQGGFIYGYLNGWPIEQCSILANACGYLKSLNIGARNMPRRELVEEFLAKKGLNYFKSPNSSAEQYR